MIRSVIYSVLVTGLLFGNAPLHAAPFKPATPASIAAPKLVVMLVIDQFRADTLARFESRYLPAQSGKTVGGFRYLMEKGAYYPLGEYDVLQCMTGPGHAT